MTARTNSDGHLSQKFNGETAKKVMTTFATPYVSYFLYGNPHRGLSSYFSCPSKLGSRPCQCTVLRTIASLVCAVLVVGEEAGQYGHGSLLVSLGQLGPLAITAAQQITFGTGTSELFS